jgi:dihydrofolate synthase/folylpolyglutamate synthase
MNAPLWEADSFPQDVDRLPIALLGNHQIANAAVACATIERLRAAGMPVSENAVTRGLASVRWPARIEQISSGPVVILDTAHNVPSIEALVQTLRASFPISGVRRVIFAVSSDKQYPEMLRVLASHFDHFHLTRYGHNPRCVPPEKLAAALAEVAPGKSFTLHATSPEAWSTARGAATQLDLICVTGSVFLAGELRHLLTPRSQ